MRGINWIGVLIAMWVAGVASLLGAGVVLALVIGFGFVPALVLLTYPLEALDGVIQRARARRRRAARAKQRRGQ